MDGGVSSQIVAQGSTSFMTFTEGVSRVGTLCICGIREGLLWLVDRSGEPFVIPLVQPSLRAKILAAQGDLKSATLIAEQGIDTFFQFLPSKFILDSLSTQ